MKMQFKTDQLPTKKQNEGIYQASTSAGQRQTTEVSNNEIRWFLHGLAMIFESISVTIEKTSVAPITKFTYLRELVKAKVSRSRTIEALPFIEKGYNPSKSVL